MNNAKILFLIGCAAFRLCLAQEVEHNFDSDSVLYTAIPKSNRVNADSARKNSYFFSLRSGFLSGHPLNYSVSMIHGFTTPSRFKIGFGVGLDSYTNLGVTPVFISLMCDFSKKREATFIAFHGGLSKLWRKENYWSEGLQSIRGGYMLNPEAGYRILYHNLRIGISVGWKFQRVVSNYERENGYWDPLQGWVTGVPIKTTVKGNINRLAVNLFVGWR